MTKTLLYIGDHTTQFDIGILINHHNVPYKPSSLMECHKGFERCSLVHIFQSGKSHHKQNLNVAAQGAVPKIPQSISARKDLKWHDSLDWGATFQSCAETGGENLVCRRGKKTHTIFIPSGQISSRTSHEFWAPKRREI